MLIHCELNIVHYLDEVDENKACENQNMYVCPYLIR